MGPDGTKSLLLFLCPEKKKKGPRDLHVGQCKTQERDLSTGDAKRNQKGEPELIRVTRVSVLDEYTCAGIHTHLEATVFERREIGTTVPEPHLQYVKTQGS